MTQDQESAATPLAEEAGPLSEKFKLDDVIAGLARDLVALRAGTISIQQAVASANLARQLFNGVRAMVSVRKMLEGGALELPAPPKEPEPPNGEPDIQPPSRKRGRKGH